MMGYRNKGCTCKKGCERAKLRLTVIATIGLQQTLKVITCKLNVAQQESNILYINLYHIVVYAVGSFRTYVDQTSGVGHACMLTCSANHGSKVQFSKGTTSEN